MRNIRFSVCLLAMSMGAFGVQAETLSPSEFTQAGQFAVSGAVQHGNMEQEETLFITNSVNIDLSVGYMVINGLQLKLGFLLQDTETTDKSRIVSNSSAGGLRANLNYYFDVLSRYNLFPHLGAGLFLGNRSLYVSTETGNVSSTTEFDFDVSQMTFGAGITQALGNAHGGFATLSIDYVQETSEPTECASVECVDIESSGLNVGVALGLYF